MSQGASFLYLNGDSYEVENTIASKWTQTNPRRHSPGKNKQFANRLVSLQGDFIVGGCQVRLSSQILLA